MKVLGRIVARLKGGEAEKPPVVIKVLGLKPVERVETAPVVPAGAVAPPLSPNPTAAAVVPGYEARPAPEILRIPGRLVPVATVVRVVPVVVPGQSAAFVPGQERETTFHRETQENPKIALRARQVTAKVSASARYGRDGRFYICASCGKRGGYETVRKHYRRSHG